MVDVLKLQDFFFEASLATYAGDGENTTLADFPGSKAFRHERGPYLYVDMCFANGNLSCGQTLIWHEGTPLWTMQYRGYCIDERAIPTLKKALSLAYRLKRFKGGRGESQGDYEVDGEYRYQNWTLHNEFGQFDGKEFVDRTGRLRHPNSRSSDRWVSRVFMREYVGGLLVAP
jgi:hypothetical protein